MSQKERFIVDANVILRFFLNDHKDHSPAARALMSKARNGEAQLEVPFLTLLETAFTLGRTYKHPQRQIADELAKLLNSPGIKSLAPSWISEALELFGTGSLSFGDACIATEARHAGLRVASFDTDFDSLPDITRFDPAKLR